MSGSPEKFTPDQLKNYAEKHIAREVEMLRWASSFLNAFSTARLSSRQPTGEIAKALQTMALESFVIHSRNLIDFLYLGTSLGQPHASDITIRDYLEEDLIREALPDLTEFLRRSREKANKLVAHLTMERETWGYYRKAWIVGQIENEVLDALRAAVNVIPLDLRSRRLSHATSEKLPLAFHLNMLPYREDDPRGAGVSISYGQDFRPDLYGHA